VPTDHRHPSLADRRSTTGGWAALAAVALVALLSACGSQTADSAASDSDTSDTTEEQGSGDDAGPDLAEARRRCQSGANEACDELYEASPEGSRNQTFGSTCGGRSEPTEGNCAGGASDDDSDIPAGERPIGLGTDRDLNALAASCHEADMVACDRLFLDSEEDSKYEEYAATCGGRTETNLFCQAHYDDYTRTEARLLERIPGDLTDGNTIAGTCRTVADISSDEIATLRCRTNEEEWATYSLFTSVAALEREYESERELKQVDRDVGGLGQCPAEFPYEESAGNPSGRFFCYFTEGGGITAIYSSTCNEPILTMFERDDEAVGEAYTFWREEGGPLCG
jgi:hypothetical protein